jgi:hypothetical protein
MPDERLLSRLHFDLIKSLIDHGACPANGKVAERMALPISEVEGLLRSLSEIHGVVLHPHVCEPWIIHPFSLTPTINWIEGEKKSWWAPCIWCAFGVAVLVGGNIRIHTRYGAESEPLVIPVVDGQPPEFGQIYVHFSIPPARAWDNVHQHCAMVLPFRSEQAIDEWCSRHGLQRGEAIPLAQVAQLAKLWYGCHADPNWRKWTVSEAQDIFHRAGLRSAFWELGARSGKF